MPLIAVEPLLSHHDPPPLGAPPADPKLVPPAGSEPVEPVPLPNAGKLIGGTGVPKPGRLEKSFPAGMVRILYFAAGVWGCVCWYSCSSRTRCTNAQS